MSKRGRHFKQTVPFQDRLETFAKEARDTAEQLQAGAEREDLLKRARRAGTAAHIGEWANSPGLQPKK